MNYYYNIIAHLVITKTMNIVSFVMVIQGARTNFCFFFVVMTLRQFTVHSSFKHNLPKSLIIPSCNLQLGQSIGQGKLTSLHCTCSPSGRKCIIQQLLTIATILGPKT